MISNYYLTIILKWYSLPPEWEEEQAPEPLPLSLSSLKIWDCLLIGIVTIPFYFEKRPQIIKALEGVAEMRKNVDSLLIINNERLRDIYTDGITTAKDAFAKADDILTTATKGIAEIITIVGTISCDFCDVETVMKNGGNALMAIGRASGEKEIAKGYHKRFAFSFIEQ